MILVDTSVSVDYTRSKGTDPKLNQLFATSSISACGIVRAEILAGARNPTEWVSLKRLLDGFKQVHTQEPFWDAVGDNAVVLRRAGVNVPFQDIVIATIAIETIHELWTRDGHFVLVQQHLPALRLFAEPP